jgi:hypothetical protein
MQAGSWNASWSGSMPILPHGFERASPRLRHFWTESQMAMHGMPSAKTNEPICSKTCERRQSRMQIEFASSNRGFLMQGGDLALLSARRS